MADPQAEQQTQAQATSFPTPPSFYQNFTPENIAQIDSLRASQSESKPSDPSKAIPIRLLDLPPELRFLQPPEPPSDGIYRCFGDSYNLNEELPSLEEQGIQQLYTPSVTANGAPSSGKYADRALVLKRIAKSLLLNFLELVGVLSVNPEQWEEKVIDLRTLFINFHHLLNEYRPHQARESLILMMQDQLERSRAETEGILQMKREVEGVLEGLGAAELAEEDGVNGAGNGVEDKEDVEDEMGVWEEVWETFGR